MTWTRYVNEHLRERSMSCEFASILSGTEACFKLIEISINPSRIKIEVNIAETIPMSIISNIISYISTQLRTRAPSLEDEVWLDQGRKVKP